MEPEPLLIRRESLVPFARQLVDRLLNGKHRGGNGERLCQDSGSRHSGARIAHHGKRPVPTQADFRSAAQGSVHRRRADSGACNSGHRAAEDYAEYAKQAVATAITIGHRLKPHNIGWFEEPVPHHRRASVVEVSRLAPVPVATGESFHSTPKFSELMRRDTVHILQQHRFGGGEVHPLETAFLYG